MKLGPGIVYFYSIDYTSPFPDGVKFVDKKEVQECEIFDNIFILTIDDYKLTIQTSDFISHHTKNNKIESADKKDLIDYLDSKKSGDIVAIGLDNNNFTIARKK